MTISSSSGFPRPELAPGAYYLSAVPQGAQFLREWGALPRVRRTPVQTGRLSKIRFVLRSDRGRVPYGIRSTAQETIRFRLISDAMLRATAAVSASAAPAARS